MPNDNSLPTPTPTSLEAVAEKLSIPQRQALTALVSGTPVVTTAQQVGVHRTTVHRWITSDPLFRAAYNAFQQEARENSKMKLLSVVQDALGAVTGAIQAGDKRMAYNLLKDLGLLSKIQAGLTNPDILGHQIRIEEARQKQEFQAKADDLGIQLE